MDTTKTTDTNPAQPRPADERAGIASGRHRARIRGRCGGGRCHRAAVGGPVGAMVGGAIGAVAGGAAGHAAGEAVNPTVEGTYWSENFKSRPYYREGRTYADYEPAYRYGWESGASPENRDREFGEAEADLQKGWENAMANTSRPWAETGTPRETHGIESTGTSVLPTKS